MPKKSQLNEYSDMCFLLGNSDIPLHRCRIPRPPCHPKRFNVLQSPVGLWRIIVSPFRIQVSIVRLEMLWAWWGKWFRMVSIFVTKGRWLLASTILSMVPPCFVRSFSKASHEVDIYFDVVKYAVFPIISHLGDQFQYHH